MLVLTRKAEQEIRIGEEIVIKVLQTTNNRVKLGITAPRNVEVVRVELEGAPAAVPQAEHGK